ncbi:MAG: hypothetical protein GXP27_03265, partial [Planctomycetes bacterium]|nr:hypothetical protein [Planctomycetota bacterium]
SHSESAPIRLTSAQQAAAGTASSQGRLSFRLKVGDRFPLIKRVSQTLKQALPQGTVVNRSEVTLLMAITVEAEEAGRKRLGVRYQRVQYSHDIAGHKIQFDSTQPVQGDLPDMVKAYRGLVGNGFSFWLSADNRILQVEGFDQFLQRCVQDIAPQRRQQFLTALAITEEDQGVANFVDDSIGLLPYDPDENGETVVRVGQSWTRERSLFNPIPMSVITQYTLTELTAREATIDVIGRIVPTTVATYDPTTGQATGHRVIIRGGHCVGQCTVDRATGLPLYSRVERFLDMVVRLDSGEEIPETKSIVTTVQAFPEQGRSVASVEKSRSEQHASDVVPAVATQEAPGTRGRAVRPAQPLPRPSPGQHP